eukprot:CAMPEP_0177755616 /NCGR_PEP_ID=MMETSP0491_2-20121128/2660_1 /TAXON_ID=63592 /ORGANISM="Tetraselmis chuii, Strain PLY429" /LENGTH=298 /DNA_ID=CAMNT_0019271123 /DNA_START=180 /DNA_END=1076 /DNA_ORIENTATION=-
MCSWPVVEACEAFSGGSPGVWPSRVPTTTFAQNHLPAYCNSKRSHDHIGSYEDEPALKRPFQRQSQFEPVEDEQTFLSFRPQCGNVDVDTFNFRQPAREYADGYCLGICAANFGNLTPSEQGQAHATFFGSSLTASGASTYSSRSTCFADESNLAAFWPEATATSMRYVPSPLAEVCHRQEESSSATECSQDCDSLVALVKRFVELWQQRLNISASEITSLTLHLWRRIEDKAQRQTCFSFQEVVACCFWVALKYFLYRPLMPRAHKMRKVVQLPQVNLAKGELAIMKWVDWSPLRGF